MSGTLRLRVAVAREAGGDVNERRHRTRAGPATKALALPATLLNVAGIALVVSGAPDRSPRSVIFGCVFGLLGTACWLVGTLLDAKRNRAAFQRSQQNECLECGYDLRTSKDRCPECGHAIEKVTHPS